MGRQSRKDLDALREAICWALVMATLGGISQAQALADIGQRALGYVADRLAPWAELYQALGIERTPLNFLLLVIGGAALGAIFGIVRSWPKRA